MNILIIGCGSFGASIATELDSSGNEISIIDKNFETFSRLPESFNGKRNAGDAMVNDVLLRARAEQAEAVVLTISNDILNLTLARMFQDKFNMKNIIALNTEPSLRTFYDDLGIHTVSTQLWGVLHIEEMLAGSMSESPLSVGASEVGVYNVVIPASAKSCTAQEIIAVKKCVVFAITHNGMTEKFTSESVVFPGDVLHVSSSTEGLRSLYTCLGSKEG